MDKNGKFIQHKGLFSKGLFSQYFPFFFLIIYANIKLCLAKIKFPKKTKLRKKKCR